MTSESAPLSSSQIASAQTQASLIATAATSTVSSNEFVFFAAFDGTQNGINPPDDGSNDNQTTAVAQLESQVALLNNTPTSNVQARYYPGVGTPPTLPGSAGYNPNALNIQVIATAQNAYNDFATQAHDWLQSHPGGDITSMVTAFSRGAASAAIFAQMLYDNGLVYTNPTTGEKDVLIPPGQVGEDSPISAALIIDPVVTEVTGNMDFPSNVRNLTVVEAQNEDRKLFNPASYAGDNATILQVTGNHGDAGDVYDNGLGGIYLQAYTSFFQNAGLNIGAVPSTRAYDSTKPVYIHSEDATFPIYDSLLNDPTSPRPTVNVGTPVAATSTGGTIFTAYDGTVVLGGDNASTTLGGSTSYQKFVVLPDAQQAQITSYSDAITVADGASLVFNSTSEIGTTNAVHGLPNTVALGTDASLTLTGWNTSIYSSNDAITLGTNIGDTTLNGNDNTITVGARSSLVINGTGNTFTLGVGASAQVNEPAAYLTQTVVTYDLANNSSLTFGADSEDTDDYDDAGTVTTVLTAPDGAPLGTLSFDTSGDADNTFTLSDGLVLDLPAITGHETLSAPSNATPLEVLEDYLFDLGYALDVNTANGAYLDPAATSTYTVTGSSTTSDGKTYTTYELSDASAPGAVVDGTGNVNTLSASDTDLTHDTISNIGTLVASGTLSLTGAEFDSFAQINGASTNLTTLSGTLTFTTSGTYSIAGSNVAGAFSLTAQAWGGTSLTGNGGDNETLTASLFGNDTLVAGNGTNDTLVAGEGVDSLTGGNGGNSGSNPSGTGDTFEASNGLAAGSTITGNSGYDILIAEGDISGATVTGVPTLYTSGATLSAAEANQFTTIYGSGTIDITGGGTVALTGKTMSSGYIFDAVSNANTTLIGADTAGDTLPSSTFAADGNGNDTLSAGDGDYDTLSAAGNGNDALTAGAGSYDSLTATGDGNDTLSAGTGTNDTLEADGAGTNTLTAAGDNPTLTANGAGDDTLTSTGNGATLNAAGTGNDTLKAYGTGDTLNATGTGDTTLQAGDGDNETLTAQGGQDTLIAGGGNGDTLTAYTGGNSLSTGNGTGNVFTAHGGDNVLQGGGGGDTFNLYDSDNQATGGSGNDTFNIEGASSGGGYSLAGSVINGGGGVNTLTDDDGSEPATLDISDTGLAITNIQKITGMNILVTSAASLEGVTTLQFARNDEPDSLEAESAGVYSLATLDATDKVTMVDLSPTGGVTLIGNNAAGESLYAGADGANDTLTGGNGKNDLLTGYGNGDTLTAGSGKGDTLLVGGNNSSATGGSGGDTFELLGSNDSAQGKGGNNTYEFGGNGPATINNYHTDSGQSVLQFGSGIAPADIVLTRSGNNLLATIIGTTVQAVVDDFFVSANYQLSIGFQNGTSWNAATISTMAQPSAITLTDGTTTTITTSGNTIDAGNNDALTLADSSANTVQVSGNNNTVTDNSSTSENILSDSASSTGNVYHIVGNGDYAAENGTGGLAIIYGTGNTINLAGTNDVVDDVGTDTTLSVTGSSDTANLDSDSGTATLSGNSNTAVINGNDNTVTVSGDDDNVYNLGTGNTVFVTGSTDGVFHYSTDDTTTLGGTNNLVTLFDNDNTVDVTGTSNIANEEGTGNNVTLDGNSNLANLFSSNTTTLNGNNNTAAAIGNDNTVNATGTNATVTLFSNSNTVGFSGSGGTIDDVGTGNAISVTGSSVSMYLHGTDGTTNVSGNSDTVVISNDNTVNVSGDNDDVYNEGTGNIVTVTNGSNDGVFHYSTNDTTTLGGSNNVVSIFDNDNAVEVTGRDNIANEEGTGNTITLDGSSNIANLYTSNITILNGNDNTAAAVGTGNTINATGIDGTVTLISGGNTVDVGGSGNAVNDVGTAGGNVISLTGSNDTSNIYDTATDTLTLDGSSNTIDVISSVTGTATATISGTSALLEFGGATTDNIIFSTGAIGTLLLSSASGFAGTVAGLANGDSIDLGNFLFSGTPSISGVSGSGAVGTATDVTVTDGSQSVTLALLNQYANQFAANASVYTLTADGIGTNAGTLLQLAASH